MNQPIADRFRRRLESLQSRVEDDKTALVEGTLGNAGRETELSNAPFHLADVGTEEFFQGLNAALLKNEANLSAEIQGALQRIDDGTFGVCEECGVVIPEERLDALPFTRYCVLHAETADDIEQVNFNDGRPQDPRETLAPEGDMEEDRCTEVNPGDLSRQTEVQPDRHAVGTPGGGLASGGLAGSNEGNGDPRISELQTAAGSSYADSADHREDPAVPQSGRTGGAITGTPADKRA